MIYGPDWEFVLNPRCASFTLIEAFAAIGYRRQWPPHLVPPKTKAIRAVVQRDEADRMRSIFAMYQNVTAARDPDNFDPDLPFDDWLAGEPFMVDGFDLKREPQSTWLDGATDIIRFDHLQDDLDAFCDKVKIPHLTLKHFHKTVA